MRALLQRVTQASVTIAGEVSGQIGPGLLILIGIEDADTSADIDWLCKKISGMRIFGDEEGKMNRSVVDVDGGLLVVSQFTLFASTKKGNRPGFTRSARPEVAIPLYESFVKTLAITAGRPVETGVFGADMQVALVNDGPVTIWVDTGARE
ncbi:D-aminoacyl-tRNA deacylase [Lewinella sp. 4G2]|uniref:D-aminoacyl-tRNA deacylase n=1 Tax=Lewinella sp. 4G2 TaxID=1803372 RepID=UPI0007B49D90|nr:D-aminoacyl-tRNA deacylase [Lewinella sp. 4G2]OAV43555.1 D-tyrosyl-tRNA(Tyr) deacylase [Lewinella sp. 4G2]